MGRRICRYMGRGSYPLSLKELTATEQAAVTPVA
jgi:hypothetical protein